MNKTRTRREEAAQRLDSYWNYIDVLQLVLAYSPITKFEGTRSKWHDVIYKIKKRFERRAPELLADLRFERRDPLPPQSDEVAEFLRTIAWSGIAEEPNPAYQVVQLKPGQQERIQERVEPRLKEYTALIRDMSKVLTKEFKSEAG